MGEEDPFENSYPGLHLLRVCYRMNNQPSVLQNVTEIGDMVFKEIIKLK